MVVWQDGDMKKDDYKRFKIRTVAGTDDFASMQEVLTRRYGRALESEGVLPDLILLDGGRGQLGAGLKALEDLGLDYIPVAALAKRPRRSTRPSGSSRSCSTWARPRCRHLQRIRDEAHRFAITYHKKLRHEADHRVGARPDPGRGADDPHEPAQDAGLGEAGAGGLGGGAGVGAENHPEAGASASMISSTRRIRDRGT